MKKLLCFLLAAIMIVTLAACGSSKPEQKDPKTEENTKGGEGGTVVPDSLVLSKGGDGKINCQIVVAADDKSTMPASASKKLADAIKTALGAAPQRVTDNTERYPETPCEIIIGKTNRAASQTVLQEIEEGEYRVQAVGKKIVILAASNDLLEKGVDDLVGAWQAADGKITLPGTLNLVNEIPVEGLALLDANGDFRYRVIFPTGADSRVTNAISNMTDLLSTTLDCGKITPLTDKNAETEYEILVGNTNRQASRDAATAQDAKMFGFRIRRVGTKIVMQASNPDILARAISGFCADVETLAKNTLVGRVCLSENYDRNEKEPIASADWYLSVPALTVGSPLGVYNEDANSCVVASADATAADFTTFTNQLKEAHFTEGNTYTAGDNRYAFYNGELATVYVSWLNETHVIRATIEKKGAFKQPAPAVKTTAETSAVLWQVEVKNLVSRQNGGMSYVFRGPDGTFFIVDGGYPNDEEATNLYNFLCSKTPAGQAPVISGWIVTHLHGDHYGCLLNFADLYADQVEVKAFYYHYTPPTDLQKAMDKWKNAVQYGKIHSGMTFQSAGIPFQVLYTTEDLYPDSTVETKQSGEVIFNNTSTAFKAFIGTQSVMFLGDAEEQESEVLVANYKAGVLASDICQYAHHGYEGGTRELYDAIRPATVLWPMNVVGNQASYGGVQNVFAAWYKASQMSYRRSHPISNNYITQEATYVKKIVVAGMGDAEITFPYAPTGDKLPDFNAYYDAHKDAAPWS